MVLLYARSADMPNIPWVTQKNGFKQRVRASGKSLLVSNSVVNRVQTEESLVAGYSNLSENNQWVLLGCRCQERVGGQGKSYLMLVFHLIDYNKQYIFSDWPIIFWSNIYHEAPWKIFESMLQNDLEESIDTALKRALFSFRVNLWISLRFGNFSLIVSY